MLLEYFEAPQIFFHAFIYLRDIYIFIYFNRYFIYLLGGGEQERESDADSALSAEPNMGLDPATMRS